MANQTTSKQTIDRRITIFAGHYGSGKTTVALNYALRRKQSMPKNARRRVAVCDLDIVNPYFRAADGKAVLEQNGISLISSELANTNVEAMYIPTEAQAVFDDASVIGVIDLGGDDRGAMALGRYAGKLCMENDYDMLLVINFFRPLTREIAQLMEVKNEIENACKIKFTGIVNNTNLGGETAFSDLYASAEQARRVGERLSLPIKMTAALSTVVEGNEIWFDNLLKMKLLTRKG